MDCNVNLTLISALPSWFDGQIINHCIHGVPVLALARLGKVLMFLGGIVVLADIIGPERLREWGERTLERNKKSLGWPDAIFVLVIAAFMAAFYFTDSFGRSDEPWTSYLFLFVQAFLALATVARFAGRGLLVYVGAGLGWLVGHQKTVAYWRALSFMMIIFGFFLDFLGA